MTAEVKATLLNWVKQNNEDVAMEAISGDSNLATEGLIDSMKFIGLIALLEELGAQNMDNIISSPEEYPTIDNIIENCFA